MPTSEAAGPPGTLAIRDYATARAVLGHPALSRRPELRGSSDPLDHHILNSDGPEHARLRQLLATALAERTYPLARTIQRTSRGLMSRLDGEVDVASRYVRPFSMIVLDELFGLSDGDEAELRWWFEQAIALNRSSQPTVTARVSKRVSDLVAARRIKQGDDVVSALVRAVDRGSLDEDQLIATTIFAFLAAFTNTANFLGLSLLALARNPMQYEWLRANPDRIPAAVEELLRFAEPPGRASFRVAAIDVVAAQTAIPSGTRVHVYRAAADRDPARFSDPERLDLSRADVAGHLAFGFGPHYCLGTRLVHLMADFTLVGLIQHAAELRPVPLTPGSWDIASKRPLPLAVVGATGSASIP